MSNNVVQLRLRELPEIQSEALRVLQVNLGFDASKDIIGRAIYEISERVHRLEKALESQDFVKIKKIASSIVPISDQLGMASISYVAVSLMSCAKNQDIQSTHAVAQRLIHLSECSLFEAVEFADWPA